MGAGASSSSEKYGTAAAKVSAVSAFADGALRSPHGTEPQVEPELELEPEPEPEPEPELAREPEPEPEPITAPRALDGRTGSPALAPPRNAARGNARPPERQEEDEDPQNLPDGVTAADRVRARARARQADLLEAAMHDVTSMVPRESKWPPATTQPDPCSLAIPHANRPSRTWNNLQCTIWIPSTAYRPRHLGRKLRTGGHSSARGAGFSPNRMTWHLQTPFPSARSHSHGGSWSANMYTLRTKPKSKAVNYGRTS